MRLILPSPAQRRGGKLQEAEKEYAWLSQESQNERRGYLHATGCVRHSARCATTGRHIFFLHQRCSTSRSSRCSQPDSLSTSVSINGTSSNLINPLSGWRTTSSSSTMR